LPDDVKMRVAHKNISVNDNFVNIELHKNKEKSAHLSIFIFSMILFLKMLVMAGAKLLITLTCSSS